ncbi:MAG: hypothetical protein IJ675_03730, partial [Pseudobutyrivibrio sp.]|nr:hypothetical protein [Pseudobutyrivibrio sp.]
MGGSATLDDLADLILESVGFDDDHLYDFEIDGEYYERMPSDFDPCEKSNVKIYSTSLKKGTKFFFNFDYGDCWRFEIKVAKVIDESGNIKPEIIESTGTVEQYPSWDDWDDYDGDNTEILDYDDGELFDNVASLETFRKLYSLGEEFKKLKPWKYLSNSDEIEIILPSGEKGYFCIMGNGEIEYGFSLY